ncbi:MAG: PEP-CTERM sorting domain-containing protein [Phycisphaerae bacterium]|nr:PEP-CTERM sorting domain-containing protein [Phycisphaerae bacterium]
MIRRTVACVLVLAMVSSAYAVIQVVPLPNTDEYTGASSASSVTVGPDHTVYVAGYSQADGGQRATYWSVSGATVTGNVLPAASDGGTATNAQGIGVITAGTQAGAIVVAGNLGGGSSDWNSGIAGLDGNGWSKRKDTEWNGGNQVDLGQTYAAWGNQLAVSQDGRRYYVTGRINNERTRMYTFTVDSQDGSQGNVVPTPGSTTDSDTWLLPRASSSNTIGGVNPASTTAGHNRDGDWHYAWQHAYKSGDTPDEDGSLPPASYDYWYSVANGISDDGNTVVGYGQTTSSILAPVYWTQSGGTWTAHYVDTTGMTSSSNICDSNQDGTILGGYIYAGMNKAVFWDVNVLDGGVPDANYLADWLPAHGVPLMNGDVGWTVLSRIHSVHSDGPLTYLAGYGAWTEDGGTTTTVRGFLVTIPEPATLAFLALGGLAMLRRRR